MLLESVNMVTAIHHTFAMLSYFLLTSKVLKDLNRVIISERQLRKYGAPQQSLSSICMAPHELQHMNTGCFSS